LPANGLHRWSPFAVNLHDTANRDLFAQEERLFSHGCVRVDRAEHFLQTLLRIDGWQGVPVEAMIAAGTTRTVDLAVPLPIFIAYFTAEPDSEGGVRFLPDVYDRDANYGPSLRN
jgi:murein L,D-transpeptidase YcbB/YkuD